ncbi:hypothetical protein [Nocardioides sambongensis]|uniref:hypothetical protein n=1 Tax=Nocardioides sambongensis TaxID=2589074 RepID=UPI001129F483|nr:hypothetical protein [Nocardioides sambongensis]
MIQVDPETGRAATPLDGSYSRLRITVEAVDETVTDSSALVGIDEIGLPGLTVDRTIVLPGQGADEGSSFVFTARGRRPTCIDSGVGTSCGVFSTARASEEESGIVRRFELAGSGGWTGTGAVLARPGRETQRLFEPVFGQVRVRASTTYLEEASVAPQFAYDGDGRTFWSSQIGDSAPTLRLEWGERRRIRTISVASAPGGAQPPTTATLIAGAESRTVDLSTGTARFAPLETRRLAIRFDVPEGWSGRLGVAELSIPGLDDLRFSIDRDQVTGSVCGLGPELAINGTVHPTRVSGTLGDIIDGTPLDLEACEPSVPMQSGRVDVGLRSTTIFAPTRLVLEPVTDAAATDQGVTERQVSEDRWEATHREITVAAGPEALLVVNENFNAGWSASLGETSLDPVRVDGWKQGFIVPEGEGGDVVLSFGPDRWYKVALVLGGLAALLLLVGAVVVARREKQRMTAPAQPGAGPERPGPVWVRIAVAVPFGLMGGPALLAGYLVGAFLRRPRIDTGLIGAIAVGAAGVLAATVADSASSPPVWCDALAAVGLGMVGAVIVLGRAPDTEGDQRDDH